MLEPGVGEQRRELYKTMMRGLPVPPHLVESAGAMARRYRVFSWTGAIFLALGAGWIASAVTGGAGVPVWLRCLFAAVALPVGGWWLFVGHKARRMSRALRDRW